MFDCKLCKFNNPKGTATAIIIRDNKVLTVTRNEEPFKGCLDFPGGYMNLWETPQETVIREIKEELNIVSRDITYMHEVAGTGEYKGKSFAVLSHFFLVDIGDADIELNEENSLYTWIPMKEVFNKPIAFNTNEQMANWLGLKMSFDLDRVRELIRQLDSSAEFDEQKLYKAILNGHVATAYNEGILVGMGWIFPRKTLLRNQAVIEDMIVDEKYRGTGLGNYLLRKLIDWAYANQVEVIELTTNPKRVAAHKLYESNGFKIHRTDHMLLNI